nr:MAG TPA: hypothetical protein [Caudoviricetes sp.]
MSKAQKNLGGSTTLEFYHKSEIRKDYLEGQFFAVLNKTYDRG